MLTIFKKKVNVLDILKRTLITSLFPVLLFFVMWIVTAANGKSDVYISSTLWIYLINDASITTIIALGIFSQFRNGRFDFSGGATMILAAILGGNIALLCNQNIFVFIIVTIVIAVALSMLSATFYIVTRVPIIIISIGVTLLYESITYMVFDAKTLNITGLGLAKVGQNPFVLILLVAAIAIFTIYTYFTKPGKEAQLLARNQKVAVQSGINENKNILITSVITGLILGLGALAYASQKSVSPQSGLSTSGILFSYVVPVYVGLFVGSVSCDVVGIVITSIGLSFMNYGLSCIGLAAGGANQIIQGLFMLLIYGIWSQMDKIKKFINFIKSKFSEGAQSNA